MDSPLHSQDYQRSGSDLRPTKSTDGTPEMHEKLASPVADKMLQLLSERSVPSGFDSAGFVKSSFLETFGKGLHEAIVSSTPERDTLGPRSKRKRCSVVDSALSIMGYDSLKVSDTKGKILVDMLTSLIQSKSSFGPACDHLGLMEGSSSSLGSRKFRGEFCVQRVSVGAFLQIVDKCKSFFASVDDDGTKVQEVMDALVKVATDTCLFAPRAESASGVFNKTVYNSDGGRRKDNIWALQSLIDFALEQKRSIYSKLRPCSRLRFWRIRPSCLKHDISSLAKEAMLRLLLPLDRELRHREEWAVVVVCLSLAPEMFMEARRLLHHWLLLSGAIRLWEVRAEVVAAVWDVVSHPSEWGVTDDIHLPPKFAFYSAVLRPFVQILEGPPTILGVLRLLKLLNVPADSRRQAVANTSEQTSFSPSNGIDHDSIWSLLIESLPWILFASKLLFKNFMPTSASTSEREMYDSPIFSGKSEGVLLESGYDSEHLYSQVAARFLAWIISPGSRLQRASDEQMLLRLSRNWGEFREGSCHAASLRLSGHNEYGALKAAVQDSYIKCTRCGSPVKEVKILADEDDHLVFGKDKEAPNICGFKSSLTLNLWLAEMQRYFKVDIIRTDREEKTIAAGDDASRMGRSSTTNSAANSASFMGHYLPLAALSESLDICNLDTVISILQFVASCRGESAHSCEQASQADDEIRIHPLQGCDSCRALLPNDSCCLQEKGKQAVSSERGKNSRDSTGGSPPHSRRSPDWIRGVAALLSILDSLDGDALLLADSSPSVVDPTEDKRRVTCNLAVIVSEYLTEWARSFEEFFSRTSPSEDNTTYKVMLQDMHCRFCKWIERLSLSEEAANICTDIKENLAMRIKSSTLNL